MSIKEKLTEYLAYKGVTPTGAEKQLGWSVGAFTKAKSISVDRAKEFLLFYKDLSSEWLFRGDGTMIIGYKQKPARPYAIEEGELDIVDGPSDNNNLFKRIIDEQLDTIDMLKAKIKELEVRCAANDGAGKTA